MLPNQIQMCLAFRELLQLAARSDLSIISPESIAQILTEFSDGYVQAQLNDAQTSQNPLGARALRGSRFEGALLKIWELSRRQSKKDPIRRHKWKSVMATCNALYEQLSFQSRHPHQLANMAA